MHPSPDETKLDVKQSEQGYVLITAIWLLILAGSIVAVVMLRTLSQAQAVKDQGSDLADKVILESAAETVFADRLFAGNKGRWWLVPVSGQVMIGGRSVDVQLSSESGRLDVNEADPRLIDQALQGLGVDADVRAGFVADAQSRRADGKRINSFAELRIVLGGRPGHGHCLDDNLTLWSGLPAPRPGQMPGALARAWATHWRIARTGGSWRGFAFARGASEQASTHAGCAADWAPRAAGVGEFLGKYQRL